jgi:RNA polymerase sigma-B factor
VSSRRARALVRTFSGAATAQRAPPIAPVWTVRPCLANVRAHAYRPAIIDPVAIEPRAISDYGDKGVMVHVDGCVADRREHDREVFEEFARTRDPSLRTDLIESHMGLVKHLVRGFTDRGEPYDDLVQVGCIALVHAVDRFDPGRGCTFATYASRVVVGELKRHFRDKGWAVRAPRRLQELYLEVARTTESLGHALRRAPTVAELARASGASEHDVREAIGAGRAYRSVSLDAGTSGDGDGLGAVAAVVGVEDDGLDGAEWRATLRPHLAGMSRRDRLILRLRFSHGLSQSEIAARVGLSQMHVSRRLRRNLDQLRAACADAEP